MGLFTAEMFSREHSEVFHRPTDDCYLCGEKLTGKVWIFWNGFGAQIWFHPRCAKSFGEKMIADWDRYKESEREKV